MAQSAQQVSEKWKNRLTASQTEITNGVNSVTTAPGQLAAAQADKWLQKTMAARDKWQANVGKVSLADWKSKMLTVGIPRISQGAAANQDKVTAFMTKFLPHAEAGAQMVKAMPGVTLEDGINRAIAMIRHNASFKN